MILKEAVDLSYVSKYKEISKKANVIDIALLVKDFLASCKFKNYEKNAYDEFVDNNISSLIIECNKYTLSMNNPFFQFLFYYAEKNSNIDPFINSSKYNILHNCVANHIINTKQLSFKDDYYNLILILENKNLWALSSESDILYLIKIYKWVLDTNMINYVTNAHLAALFKKLSINTEDKIKQVLLKCLYFSDIIIKITDDKIKNNKEDIDYYLNNYQLSMKQIVETNLLPSGQFISVDVIEESVGYLNDNLSANNRDTTTGKYKNKDTINKKDTKQDNNISTVAKNQILDKANDVMNFIKNTYNVNNNVDIKKILSVIIDKLQ